MAVTRCGEQGAFDLVLALRIGFRLRPDVPEILRCAPELERTLAATPSAGPALDHILSLKLLASRRTILNSKR
jgi:hypothetical protein